MSSSPPSRPRNTVGSTARCRSCGSRLRPEETWCSLCHHRVSDPADSEPAASREPAPGGGFDPDWKPKPNRARAQLAEAEADRLIARLAAAEADRDRESGLATLQGKLGAYNGGVLAAIGGLVLLGIGVVGLTLLGLLL